MFEAVKLSMKNWDIEDLPREKMSKYGIKALSDAELLAIVINSGSKNESALELAKRILKDNQNELDVIGKLSVERLKSYKGIGEKKATNILAALELGRRRLMTERNKIFKISCSNDAFEILRVEISDLSHEEFWVLYLDRSNKVIDKRKISQGGISGTVIDVRIILKQAIEKLASAIILSHNHPSGNVRPSQNDLDITKKALEAAKLVDIKVLDHLIICGSEYLSLADEGLIT
ncbi:MAG: DNA repair protein RadC [Prolixibacteraceae bacterium]|nr:DNA repair protein RadC [Prolixibacteraceae bacterium]